MSVSSRKRFRAIIQAYRDRDESEREKSLLEFVGERDPNLFSHHPPGPCFRDHVWVFRGLYFCKGCVMTGAGLVTGGLAFAATGWMRGLTDAQTGLFFVLLLLPTLLSPLLRLPRPLKHVARFLLGVVMISAVIFLFVTDSWLARAVVVATYFCAKIPLERTRNRINASLSAPEKD